MTHPDPRPATPAAALAELLAGNHRFVTGTRIHPNQDAEHRAALAAAQRPFAVLFGCSDSRLAAEIIFDRGLGDLFVVRTAGHVIGPEVLASISYGVTVLGAPLVVVLGHESCGAIATAVDALAGASAPGPHLSAIIDRVVPSVRAAQADGRGSVGDPDVVAMHVRRSVALIRRPDSGLAEAGLAEAESAGRCAVVGMVYRLSEGRVTVIDRSCVR